MCIHNKNFRKISFDNIFSDLRDSDFELFGDFSDMVGIEFDESLKDSESMKDYADNLFLFLDIWIEYLETESFIYYKWLDVDIDCFWEARYNIKRNYIIAFFIFFLLFSFGFYYIGVFYLLFAISWNCYDDEPEHDPDNPREIIKEVKKYMHIKRVTNQRSFLHESMISTNLMLSGLPTKWRAFHCLYIWHYDTFIIDDLFFLQISFNLGRYIESDTRKILSIQRRCKNRLLNFHNLYFFEIMKIFFKLEKKNNGIFYKKFINFFIIFWQYPYLMQNFYIKQDRFLLKNKATDYELYLFNLYVKNWHFFKNSMPYKYNKYNYIL
jgi:hypothetical protein